MEGQANGRLGALWVDYVDTLFRRRRLVLIGIGATWVCLAAVLLGLQSRYRCEATLSIPPSITPVIASVLTPPSPASAPPPDKPGLGFDAYKKLESFISDGRELRRVAADVLSPAEIDSLVGRITDAITPIASGSRDDIGRSLPTDTVVAIRISYEARQREKAVRVVEKLADLVRAGRVQVVALDRLELVVAKAIQSNGVAGVKMGRLAVEKDSLKMMERDLLSISANAASDRGREIVDVADGGHRYLPITVQVVGVRSEIAQNGHDMRLAAAEVWTTSRLASLVKGALEQIRAGEPPEDSLDAALANLAGEARQEARIIEAEIRMLREVLRTERDATRFLQEPTAHAPRRVSALLKSLVLATVIWIGLAWLVEAWSRAKR